MALIEYDSYGYCNSSDFRLKGLLRTSGKRLDLEMSYMRLKIKAMADRARHELRLSGEQIDKRLRIGKHSPIKLGDWIYINNTKYIIVNGDEW